MEYAKKNSVDNRKCGCDDKSCSDYAMWVTEYTKEYKVLDPILIVSVMMQESHCNHYQNGIVKGSSAGAVGLMQIMPDTGKGTCSYNLQDLYDEEKNIKFVNYSLSLSFRYCYESLASHVHIMVFF